MKDFTDITVLLDRSGSMSSIKDDVIGGFNEFVAAQKQAGENANLTLVQFDTQGIDTVQSTRIMDAKDLTVETYKPRAGTPLLDALGSTINKTGERLAAISENDRADKVVFVIITDGEKNSSKEYTKLAVKNLIDQQSVAYKWQFVYLGANQDAFHEAGGMGIGAAAAANFAPSQMRAVFDIATDNLAKYRQSNDVRSLSYTSAQRKRMSSTKRPS